METEWQYGVIDAAAILLREGMEALLVLVALLAFLEKSNHGAQKRWIWVGAGLGVIASVVAAIVIQLLFAHIPLRTNRELLEGIVGLVAAALLFYVSYWLHRQSALGGWQNYIKEQVTVALAQERVFSLAFLAFLAVFREGGETVLFYLGIAPSIRSTDLLTGIGLAIAGLAVLTGLMLGIGMRIPLKPFFQFTSLLIYYLGFKFVGSSVHALQVAGVLPTDTAQFLPAFKGLGLYPTWETTLAQAAVLIGAIVVVLWMQRQSQSNHPA